MIKRLPFFWKWSDTQVTKRFEGCFSGQRKVQDIGPTEQRRVWKAGHLHSGDDAEVGRAAAQCVPKIRGAAIVTFGENDIPRSQNHLRQPELAFSQTRWLLCTPLSNTHVHQHIAEGMHLKAPRFPSNRTCKRRINKVCLPPMQSPHRR